MVFRFALSTLRLRSPEKALALGIDLHQIHGDTAAACVAFDHAIRSGHPDLAPAGLWWTGTCLRERGDRTGAAEFFRRAIGSGHANWAPRAEVDLAELSEQRGDVARARMHYQRAMNFRRDGTDAIWAQRAAVKLEVMLIEHGAVDGARAVHDRATDHGQFDKRMSFALNRAHEWQRRGNVAAAIESLHEVIAECGERAPAVAARAAAMLDALSHRTGVRRATGGTADRTGPGGLTGDVAQRLLRERIILLSSEIDDAAANEIVAQLLLMEQDDPTADIHFFINSPGGLVTAGTAILDTMRLIRPDVVTWAAGLAAGMAQVLLSGGTPGKRYALPHAKVQMRKPVAPRPATDRQLDLLAATLRETTGLVAAQTGQSVEQVAADIDAQRWFSAEEARDYGLVDGIRSRLGHDRR